MAADGALTVKDDVSDKDRREMERAMEAQRSTGRARSAFGGKKSEEFAVDPAELRRADPERYLELSRSVSGEVMSEVFGEWRRAGSSYRCRK